MWTIAICRNCGCSLIAVARPSGFATLAHGVNHQKKHQNLSSMLGQTRLYSTVLVSQNWKVTDMTRRLAGKWCCVLSSSDRHHKAYPRDQTIKGNCLLHVAPPPWHCLINSYASTLLLLLTMDSCCCQWVQALADNTTPSMGNTKISVQKLFLQIC